VEALDGVPHQTALVGSKNTSKNRELQSLKRQTVAGLSFAKINSVTFGKFNVVR
jgi:hypothetical protein